MTARVSVLMPARDEQEWIADAVRSVLEQSHPDLEVIVAEGFHAAAGQPHAEVMALRALGRPPRADAVLHVTLEPCCTHGRTPPCVEAILRAGLRTVVVGATVVVVAMVVVGAAVVVGAMVVVGAAVVVVVTGAAIDA